MKRLFLFLMAVLITISAQSQKCSSPVSSIEFQQKFNQISAIRKDQQRLDAASEFTRKNCLLTYQVKQIAEIFKDDISRLNFIQDAYPTIFDKENIYDLYDAFSRFSSAMRLHDFIENLPKKNPRPGQHSEIPDRPYSFPEYNYPSYENYHETTICSKPISDEAFYQLARNLMNMRDDDSRLMAAIQLAEGNCLTVSQIMKLGSLIEKESKRLDYLKRSYDHTYDIGNFHYNNQLFKEKTYHTDFETFVNSRRNRPDRDERRRERPCSISDTEFQEIIANIKAQSFDNTKLEMTKQIVRSKQCFNTLQVKQLIGIFSFENTKLELAKFCYPFCIDKSDYYKINSSLTFSTSVDELTRFVNEQK